MVGNGRTPGEKHEEGIGRIRQKHGKVGGVLREKMANVGQARGRLAHVQFALSMLEKVRFFFGEGKMFGTMNAEKGWMLRCIYYSSEMPWG